MLVRLLALCACLAFSFASCATAPSAEAIAAADIGEKPDLEQTKQAAMYLQKQALFDPTSAQFIWGEDVTRGWFAAPLSQAEIAWRLDFSMNGKNKLGGFTGMRRNAILVDHGNVIAYTRETSVNGQPSTTVVRVDPPRPVSDLAAEYRRTFGQLDGVKPAAESPAASGESAKN